MYVYTCVCIHMCVSVCMYTRMHACGCWYVSMNKHM